jgi:uncharacterized damage-inducible protein DinB
MDAAQQPQAELTIGQMLPWTSMTLDYTEKVASKLTDELRDWRPVDPSGKFFFSLGEIVAHSADTRRMWARQLAGSESEDGYWSIGDDGPSEDGIWKFHPLPSAAELVQSLKDARAELQPFLDRPASEQWSITEGNKAIFEKNLAHMREKGIETAEAEKRGPANINRVLFAIMCHESGHRGALQTLLRQHGIDTGGEH